MNDLIEQLQGQVQTINTSLKNGGISAALQAELSANQMLLQGWVNKLVAGGTLTNNEIQQLQDALDSSKKKTLQAQSERTKRIVIISGVGLIIVITVIGFFYFKNRRK